MVNSDMYRLGSKRSAIREVFEFGRRRAAAVGKENVYDFSLGNPSVPPPPEVKAAFLDILNDPDPMSIHGYTSAPGNDAARDAIAEGLNKRYNTKYTRRNLYLTCGAAAALTATFKALTLDENTEFVAIAPYFPEYTCFSGTAGAKLVVVPADEEEFQIDFGALAAAVNGRTQAVVINSPNNPSGVVYSENTIARLAALLTEKSAEIGHTVYLISDEPYRELYYEAEPLPFVAEFYPHTIVCYSFSKCLSIPGERIGYLLVPDGMEGFDEVCDAIAGAARSLGYVCAPSILQRVAARCADVRPDLTAYRQNRDLLYAGLTKSGYRCAKPSGAFYMFIEAPNGDAASFCEMAKAKDVLLVNGADFGCPRHVRISYCVDHKTIERALPLFDELIKEIRYGG